MRTTLVAFLGLGLGLATSSAHAADAALDPGTQVPPADKDYPQGDYLEVSGLPLSFVSTTIQSRPLGAPSKKLDSTGSRFSAVDPTVTLRASLGPVVIRAGVSDAMPVLQVGYQLHDLFELGVVVAGRRNFDADMVREETEQLIQYGSYGFFRFAFNPDLALEAQAQLALVSGKFEAGEKNTMTGITDLTESRRQSGLAFQLRVQLVVRISDRIDFTPGIATTYLGLTQETLPVPANPNAPNVPTFVGETDLGETAFALIPVGVRFRF